MVTRPRCQHWFGDTDIIPLGHSRNIQTHVPEWHSIHAPTSNFTPKGVLCWVSLGIKHPFAGIGEHGHAGAVWLIPLVRRRPMPESLMHRSIYQRERGSIVYPASQTPSQVLWTGVTVLLSH